MPSIWGRARGRKISPATISAAIAAGIRVEASEALAGQDVDRLQRPEDDEGEAADRAGDQEEDRRAADREGGGDPGADQDHGAERQPAAAAGGQEDVGALLDHADVEGLAPAEPAVEGAAQGDDEAQHREQLEDEGEHDPARLGVLEAVADRRQEGDPDDRGGGQHGEAGGERAVDEDRVPVRRLLTRRVGLLAAVSFARGFYELEHP